MRTASLTIGKELIICLILRREKLSFDVDKRLDIEEFVAFFIH
jgi:hypothetical protein